MSANSKIEWCDHTFNAWWGCVRVSPACRFCYADTTASRYGHQLWRKNGDRRMLSDNYWRQPLRWNREAEAASRPALVFCSSMADVFEDRRDLDAPRERLWELIDATPWLIWQLLTKRPENVARLAPWGGNWPDRVWLGTSVENQQFAEQRIPALLEIPARVRFLSCEPLLGPIDLTPWTDHAPWTYTESGVLCTCGAPMRGDTQCPAPQLDWVIGGGESGAKARPSHPDWFRSLRDQCKAAGAPYFHKQFGEHVEVSDHPQSRDLWVGNDGAVTRWHPGDSHSRTGLGPFRGSADNGSVLVRRVGKKTAGRELDGRIHDEMPARTTEVA